MTLAAQQLARWRRNRDRLVQAHGETSIKVTAAEHEILCWEMMAELETRATALLESARAAQNVPGQIKYHLDRLAAATNRP